MLVGSSCPVAWLIVPLNGRNTLCKSLFVSTSHLSYAADGNVVVKHVAQRRIGNRRLDVGTVINA